MCSAHSSETAPSPARSIRTPRTLPNGRTVLGGLLVTIAIVGTFLAADSGSPQPEGSYVVTTRSLSVGEVLTDHDVITAPMTLTDALTAAAFQTIDGVVGTIVVHPLHSGELITSADIASSGTKHVPNRSPIHEVSFSVAIDRIPPGVVAGDRVTVLATNGSQTDVASENAPVLAVEQEGNRALIATEAILTLAVSDAVAALRIAHLTHTSDLTIVRTTRALDDVWPDRYVADPVLVNPVPGSDQVPALVSSEDSVERNGEDHDASR